MQKRATKYNRDRTICIDSTQGGVTPSAKKITRKMQQAAVCIGIYNAKRGYRVCRENHKAQMPQDLL